MRVTDVDVPRHRTALPRRIWDGLRRNGRAQDAAQDVAGIAARYGTTTTWRRPARARRPLSCGRTAEGGYVGVNLPTEYGGAAWASRSWLWSARSAPRQARRCCCSWSLRPSVLGDRPLRHGGTTRAVPPGLEPHKQDGLRHHRARCRPTATASRPWPPRPARVVDLGHQVLHLGGR